MLRLSSIFVSHFLIALRQLSRDEQQGRFSHSHSTWTATYDSSVATMGGHIKIGLHFATPSGTDAESTQDGWDVFEHSGEDIELNVLTP